jgi:hypothetical protein
VPPLPIANIKRLVFVYPTQAPGHVSISKVTVGSDNCSFKPKNRRQAATWATYGVELGPGVVMEDDVSNLMMSHAPIELMESIP